MIEMTPTEEQIKEAHFNASHLLNLQGSITKGAGSIAGALGEIVVRDFFNYVQASSKNYDMYTSEGKTIDVKTKRCSSAPRGYYECSINSQSLHQQCDEYIFVRVLKNLKTLWIVGRIDKDKYFEKATRYKAGDKDESNNFIFKSTSYNLAIEDLCPIQQHDCSASPSS